MMDKTQVTETALHERMQKWAADNASDPRSGEMRSLAVKLENAISPMKSPPQVIGAWARARKFWCYLTGEDLV
jgi:hypothetical protein